MSKFNNLNIDSILKIYDNDYKRLAYVAKRTMDKMEVNPAIVDWHNPQGYEYKIVCIMLNPHKACFRVYGVGGSSSIHHFYDFSSNPFNSERGIVKISRHYLERYQKRKMKKNLFVENEILRDMAVDNMTDLLLYEDHENNTGLMATLHGIAIASAYAKGICTYKTFVSYDMLHEDQRKAFEYRRRHQMGYVNFLINGDQRNISKEEYDIKHEDEMALTMLCSQAVIEEYKNELND